MTMPQKTVITQKYLTKQFSLFNCSLWTCIYSIQIQSPTDNKAWTHLPDPMSNQHRRDECRALCSRTHITPRFLFNRKSNALNNEVDGIESLIYLKQVLSEDNSERSIETRDNFGAVVMLGHWAKAKILAVIVENLAREST